MNRCRLCVIPDTRPDTQFTDGVCSACLSYAKRKTVDWASRKRELEVILETGHNDSGFDCIVPSSGGKDSHWQTLTLLEMGARPLVVTATTCHLTKIGRMNIDNLARYATTLEVTPDRTVRAKLNRLGLRLVGDISWPEHVSIFTTPFRIACDLGIPLVFYGENPQEAYGGPQGADETREMTRRWVSEFGGFLGLRPADMIGQEGITERDMWDYMPPSAEKIAKVGVRAYFLGQFFEWDSHRNAQAAKKAGMLQKRPSGANLWNHENLDNAQTGIHDYMMFRKYGYGRGCAQVSVDVRAGRITRGKALRWIKAHDGRFPFFYGGINACTVLRRIGMNPFEFIEIIQRFSNKECLLTA